MGRAERSGTPRPPGHPLLRAEIAALYPGLEADDVLVFAAPQEAIFAFAQAALGGDDHAVVVTPAYQSLHEVARAAGAQVSTVELEHDSGWALDLDEVRRALRPETRAIVVNFPHNPTGAHIDRATLDGAGGDRRGGRRAPLLRRGLPLARAPARRAAARRRRARRPARLSLGVMSKTFALPGLRIGWLACRDRELLARIAAIKDYTTICSSAPSEILALIALRRRDEVVARSRAIVDANLPLLDDFFARSEGRFEWARPRGAAIGFPRLVARRGDRRLRARARGRGGRAAAAGLVYEHAGNHFRLGFGRRNMPEALERLERFAGARL